MGVVRGIEKIDGSMEGYFISLYYLYLIIYIVYYSNNIVYYYNIYV